MELTSIWSVETFQARLEHSCLSVGRLQQRNKSKLFLLLDRDVCPILHRTAAIMLQRRVVINYRCCWVLSDLNSCSQQDLEVSNRPRRTFKDVKNAEYGDRVFDLW